MNKCYVNLDFFFIIISFLPLKADYLKPTSNMPICQGLNPTLACINVLCIES